MLIGQWLCDRNPECLLAQQPCGFCCDWKYSIAPIGVGGGGYWGEVLGVPLIFIYTHIQTQDRLNKSRSALAVVQLKS